MADILVQNAISQLTDAIVSGNTGYSYSKIFGKSLAQYLADLAIANPSTGPFASVAGAGKCLCTLSEYTYMTYCQCSYSGAGQNCTCQCVTTNVWRNGEVLTGSGASLTLAEISTAIRAVDRALSDLYDIDTASAQVNKFNRELYTAWIESKAILLLDAATNAAPLSSWHGVGGGDYVPGSKLSNDYVKVCGTDWTHGEGATCTWTVPAGATAAKFQIWGAGQGSNPACCCGGSPFASTGAYSEITLTVAAGDTYTVCAGCTCAKYCCSNDTPGPGCMSGVIGNGICCAMASGASSADANCNNLNATRCCHGSGSACRRYQNPWCTDSGPCWCGLGEYCYDSSCATCGVVPTYPNCCHTPSCSCATLTAVLKDGGTETHRGIIGGGCLDTNNYGWHTRPPVIDADTGLNFADGCYAATFTSNCCCGGCNGKDWTYHPGHGGTYTHTMGGNNNHKGDTGRGGMVQISWAQTIIERTTTLIGNQNND